MKEAEQGVYAELDLSKLHTDAIAKPSVRGDRTRDDRFDFDRCEL